MSSGGDSLKQLPVNREQQAKPGDLELIHQLFQPSSAPMIKQTLTPFKTAIGGALLFGLLSLPFVAKLVSGLTKGSVIAAHLVLMVAFLIIFFILTRTVLK
jgi:hypothetical protein